MLIRVRQHVMHPTPLLLAGVALLAAAVTTSATVAHLDAALGRLARAATAGISHDAGYALSALGGTDLVTPLAAAAAAVLVLLRHWRGALTLVLALVATQGVVQLIKVWVERPRPAANHGLAEAAGFSFPSAHSATSMALYATLALVAARACRPRGLRAAVLASAAALVAAIGLSRILLAAHYPIDVLAGWFTGAALVGASWLLAKKLLAPGPSGAFPDR
jgi:membrane-associated phospholipid phosphatase